jgi:hypothetical protein
MKMPQESDFVGKGFADSFQRLAHVNSGHDSETTWIPPIASEIVVWAAFRSLCQKG